MKNASERGGPGSPVGPLRNQPLWEEKTALSQERKATLGGLSVSPVAPGKGRLANNEGISERRFAGANGNAGRSFSLAFRSAKERIMGA